jgi:hypothetical protein
LARAGYAAGRVLIQGFLIPTRVELRHPLGEADLYGHSWHDCMRVGYSCFWISRIDGDGFTPEELAELQSVVTYDLLFDYSQEELDIGFDDISAEGSLLVTVQDHVDSEEEPPG